MLNCLQAGRALAALAVLAFHLSIAFGDPVYGDTPIGVSITGHGNLGVDFFFVLSGFIILNAHHKDIGQPKRWAVYLWRRFARVYPIYWIYAGGFCFLLLLGFGRLAQPPKDLAAWLSTFSLVRFSVDQPPLHVAWTLFHEVAFYAIFSILILNRWLGMAALGAWAAACLAFGHYYADDGLATVWHVYLSAYNLQFFIGMGAYLLYRHGRWPWLLFAAGLMVAALATYLAYAADHVIHLLFVSGFGLSISGASILEERGALKSPQWLVRLGGASYSLYLVHVPVSGFLLRLAKVVGLTARIPAGALWWVVFVATAAVAYGAWILLEKPLLKALRGRATPAPQTASLPATPAP